MFDIFKTYILTVVPCITMNRNINAIVMYCVSRGTLEIMLFVRATRGCSVCCRVIVYVMGATAPIVFCVRV